MTSKQVLAFLGLTIFLVTCGPKIKMLRLEAEHRQPSRHVEVYESVDRVDFDYAEIAIITIENQGQEYDKETLLQALIGKAKEIGADGIVLLDMTGGQTSVASEGRSGSPRNLSVLRATAIVRE